MRVDQHYMVVTIRDCERCGETHYATMLQPILGPNHQDEGAAPDEVPGWWAQCLSTSAPIMVSGPDWVAKEDPEVQRERRERRQGQRDARLQPAPEQGNFGTAPHS